MSDISVEEFKKFETMDLPFSYNEVLLIIEEVKEHPLLWHSFGDKRKLAIEWNKVEMKLLDDKWTKNYGEIRNTWRYLYHLYMADRTNEFLFEDQMDFLWEYRAEAYWIWDEEEEDYKYPEVEEPIPEDAIFFWDEDDSNRHWICRPSTSIKSAPLEPCVDCSEYHDNGRVVEHPEFSVWDFVHSCFDEKTCWATRTFKAYRCYHGKQIKFAEEALPVTELIPEETEPKMDEHMEDQDEAETQSDEDDTVSDDSGIMDTNQEQLEEEEEPAPAPQAAAPANQGQWKYMLEMILLAVLVINLAFLMYLKQFE